MKQKTQPNQLLKYCLVRRNISITFINLFKLKVRNVGFSLAKGFLFFYLILTLLKHTNKYKKHQVFSIQHILRYKSNWWLPWWSFKYKKCASIQTPPHEHILYETLSKSRQTEFHFFFHFNRNKTENLHTKIWISSIWMCLLMTYKVSKGWMNVCWAVIDKWKRYDD